MPLCNGQECPCHLKRAGVPVLLCNGQECPCYFTTGRGERATLQRAGVRGLGLLREVLADDAAVQLPSGQNGDDFVPLLDLLDRYERLLRSA